MLQEFLRIFFQIYRSTTLAIFDTASWFCPPRIWHLSWLMKVSRCFLLHSSRELRFFDTDVRPGVGQIKTMLFRLTNSRRLSAIASFHLASWEQYILNPNVRNHCSNSHIQVFRNALQLSYEIYGVSLRCPMSCDRDYF